ncbi:Hypothetical protein CINCED_3A024330 [Cinara cedri]|uniref:Uncharacterized protein n=1 Tax=Cinara cedri TaxID=506608 RepID=A0A5E4MEZ8_9HEMI|nr:Hypothetical protein CINCED_3A024330 [Cinara cedri]
MTYNSTATAIRGPRRWSPPQQYAAASAATPPSPRAMSDSSSGTMTHRKYVDPWDLDLREVSWRHSSDTTDYSADQVVSLSSATGPESTRSDFVYVPGPSKGKSARTRARSVPRYECCQCSPKTSLVIPPPDQTEMYEYWEPGCKRQPPYRYATAVDDHFYSATSATASDYAGPSTNQCCLLYNVSGPEVRRNSRYNNSDVDSAQSRAYETSSGEYNSAEHVMTPSQFRFNTLGHMKIDYSSNWNNLDKYICQV